MSSRIIKPKMVDYLDAKLAANGLAQHAIDIKDARLVFGLAAESCVGIREVGGNNMGPMVELIQSTVGRAEGEPWCLAFVQTCIAYAELKTGIKSPVIPSEHCRTTWEHTPKSARVQYRPNRYALVFWGYDGSSSGHVGIYLEGSFKHNKGVSFRSIEGNTNSDGAREGDGVYYKNRDWMRTGNLIKLGFMKPF